MGRPSNPHLMGRVLDAIKHLGEGRGSSARQVLELLRQGNNQPTRNLAMQVQRALKNAVTAGLLQLRSGRYKMLLSMQTGANNRVSNKNGDKTVGRNSGSKKKEDLEEATDSSSLQPLERGPRSRCSHCKKHKRKGGKKRRRRKKGGIKRRRRPTRQASERNSRRLRRRGDEEVSPRRERRRKITGPDARGQSEVPNGPRSERQGKTKGENSQDLETRESDTRGNRDRSESSSDTEGEEDAPNTTRGKRSLSGRRRVKNARKRSSSAHRNSSNHQVVDNGVENYPEEVRMDCCDEDGDQDQEIPEEDVCKDCDRDGGSRTSI